MNSQQAVWICEWCGLALLWSQLLFKDERVGWLGFVLTVIASANYKGFRHTSEERAGVWLSWVGFLVMIASNVDRHLPVSAYWIGLGIATLGTLLTFGITPPGRIGLGKGGMGWNRERPTGNFGAAWRGTFPTMRNAGYLGMLATIIIVIGAAGLAVKFDGFFDARIIGNPLAKAALQPLKISSLDDAKAQAFDGEGDMLLFTLFAAAVEGSGSGGDASDFGYALIDAGTKSFAEQLSAKNARDRLPYLYALKAYMYISLTPGWAWAMAAAGGMWLRHSSRIRPWH